MTFVRPVMVPSVTLGAARLALAVPVEAIPPEFRGAIQPQVAFFGSDEVHVAFGRGGSLHCATPLDGGRTFKPPVAVGSLEKLALGKRRGSRVAVGSRGVVITAISHADGNLVSWHSNDLGLTWPEARRINSAANSAREGLHAMGGDGRGACLGDVAEFARWRTGHV